MSSRRAVLGLLQIRLGSGPVHEGADGYRPVAVPEAVEYAGDFPHHRAAGGDVQIAKVGVRVDLEVVIPDVAPADDGQGVIHHQGLVVHAVIEPLETRDEFEPPRTPMGKGVDHPDLDVRVCIQCREGRVPALEGHVVEQQAHAHPAIGGTHQTLGQQPAGGVRFPDVVLQVERLLGELGERGPGGKGNLPAADDREAGLAGVARGGLVEVATERGAGMVLEGLGLGARVVLRHAGAAGEEEARQPQTESNRTQARAKAGAISRSIVGTMHPVVCAHGLGPLVMGVAADRMRAAAGLDQIMVDRARRRSTHWGRGRGQTAARGPQSGLIAGGSARLQRDGNGVGEGHPNGIAFLDRLIARARLVDPRSLLAPCRCRTAVEYAGGTRLAALR